MRETISIFPVNQFTRTSKPVPNRVKTITPPQDIPEAKKVIVEITGRRLQRRGRTESNTTSPGKRTVRPLEPALITRAAASISVVIAVRRLMAVVRSDFRSDAASIAYASSRDREVSRGRRGSIIVAVKPMMANTQTTSSNVKPASLVRNLLTRGRRQCYCRNVGGRA